MVGEGAEEEARHTPPIAFPWVTPEGLDSPMARITRMKTWKGLDPHAFQLGSACWGTM